MKILLRKFKPYLLQLILLIGLTYITVLTNLALPEYMAEIINKGIVGKDNTLIYSTGYRMLAVSLLGAVCTIAVGYLASKIATGFSRDVRSEMFTRVEDYSLAEFNKFSTASLITRTTNDIQQIQMVLIMLLRMVLSAPIMGVGAIIKAYHTAPSMTWLMALAVSIMLVVIIILFSVALPKFKILQKLLDKLNLVARENLTGLRVIRAFNNEEFQEKKFDLANIELTQVNLFVNRLMVIMQPFMMLIFNITSIAIIWFGAKLIDSSNLSIGEMMAFMQYAMQVIMSFLMFSIIFIMVPRASVSAQRIAEVLASESSIKESKNPTNQYQNTAEKIRFENVVFSYPGADKPALIDISFSMDTGKTTAIVGGTGSGKSTLINLIPRFYDVSKGRILIDNVDIKNIRLSDLHDKLGYVPQQGVLFSGTVESNIKYGDPSATKEKVGKAARISQSSEFIEKLKDKYDDVIAQGGHNVSGGQKQRLSIARAIIKNPEIYIFDDSFSALDFKTDSLLRRALKEETENKTVLIVAQRISTIIDADKIVVLDEGKIIGIGKHAELMQNCQIYREIASTQLSEKELSGDNTNGEGTLLVSEAA